MARRNETKAQTFKHMAFNQELLDQIITSAEFLKALSMSVEVGEYKGWTVRVSLEHPDSKLKDMHVI